MFEKFDIPQTEAEDEKLRNYEKQLQEQERADALRRYKNSGVPERFFDESFETFKTTTEAEQRAKIAVMKFAENPQDKVLILYGENGNGKTHLGSSVIRECDGVYILSSTICIEYESATSYKAPCTRTELLNKLATCKMLVIDECCKYFLNTELEKFLLGWIISARYANKLPTVLITNGKKEAFVNFLGKAVYDRLTEVCISVEFNWESKRKELRNE